MPNLIILCVFGGLLFMAICGALAMYIAGEKGRSTLAGFWAGFFLTVPGVIAMAFLKQTDENVVKEMHDRKMMDLKEFDKTMEFVANKEK